MLTCLVQAEGLHVAAPYSENTLTSAATCDSSLESLVDKKNLKLPPVPPRRRRPFRCPRGSGDKNEANNAARGGPSFETL